jgi:hypothetical protein
LCQLGQTANGSLKGLFFAFNDEAKVGSQWGRIEGRDEDVARCHVGIGDDVVGTLFHEGPYTGVEPCCLHLFGGSTCGDARQFNYMLLSGVFLDDDAEHFASLASIDGLNSAADGADEFDFRVKLVCHKGRSRLDSITCFDHHLWSHTRKVIRHQEVVFVLLDADNFQLRLPCEVDVQTFSELNHTCH